MTRHCMDCGQPFTRGREPAASRPLRRLPPSRVMPAVAVTLYGSVCGPCAEVTPESPAEAAQEGARDAQAPKPADAMPPGRPRQGALHRLPTRGGLAVWPALPRGEAAR